jgi:phage FluMu protein gp41
MIRTEYEFILPVGYQDEEGTLHRDGAMRLATASDEISPLRDGRVQANPAYLIVILLSRVVTRLGSVAHINPKTIESLYAADLAYLQNLYNEVNQVDQGNVAATCPQCRHSFEMERPALGGF